MDATTERLRELLAPLTNYERTRPDQVRWSLDGMRALLERPGATPLPAPLVQVGGSKGKGTTTLYVEALAAAAGLTTGAYLSPHLESMLERVRVRGRSVTEAELTAALEPVLAHARDRGLAISFFEAMTAAALGCFAAARVQLGVLEVGLGGRLDATTAVPVAASILTGVELEHTELLGDTVEAIASEKAWIVRPGGLALTAASGPALAVVERHAASVGAPLLVLGRDFGLEDVRDRGSGFTGVLRAVDGSRHPFTLPGAATFELQALALAWNCLRELPPAALGGGLRVGLDPAPRPHLPGRCEVVATPTGPVVLDGAHTPGSAAQLVAELRRRFGFAARGNDRGGVHLLFASARGKRWSEELSLLLPLVDTAVVTAVRGTISEDPAAIAAWLRSHGIAAAAEPETDVAVRDLLARSGVRVVTGSFYLVGEARASLRAQGECS